MTILLVDNYDSFTWNLVQAFGVLGATVETVRNDAVDPGRAASGAYTHVVLSPGPGRPERAGATEAIVRACSGRVPLLGVCLGHQAIATALGGAIAHAPVPMHGKRSEVMHDGTGLFDGLPHPLVVGRYHSLVVDPDSLPAALEVTARAGDGAIMALRHREHATAGVQFHPESILTPHGPRLLGNFLALGARAARTAAGGGG